MSQSKDSDGVDQIQVSDIYYQTNSGEASGTFLNGKWLTRSLNKITGNNSVDLNVNKSIFTLKPGNYMITCSLPAYNVGFHQARLFNVTANKTAKYGNSSIASDGNQSLSMITYYTGNLSSKTKFRVEHQCQNMKIINGFGISSNFSSNESSDQYEIYGEVQIIKLS